MTIALATRKPTAASSKAVPSDPPSPSTRRTLAADRARSIAGLYD